MQNAGSAAGGTPQSAGGWPASWLYVPANKPALMDKAAGSAAGALIVDLEDAVPQSEKAHARRNTVEWLTKNALARNSLINDGLKADQQPGCVNGKQVWVRINAEHVGEDVAAITTADGTPLCAGVILAKAEPVVLDQLEASSSGSLPAIGLVESAAGLRWLEQMAAAESLVTFGIGEVDLLADLRIRRSPAAEPAIDAIRLQIVIACAAAGLQAPIAPTSVDFRDLDAFEVGTRKFQDLGFRARTAIHPAQCPVVNSVFTPTAEEIAQAKNILDRSAAAAGGVALDSAGRLIDAAVVRGAVETLGRAPAESVEPSMRRN